MSSENQPMSVVVVTSQQLHDSIVQRLVEITHPGRTIVGIAGPPASGKSSLLHELVDRLRQRFNHDRVIGIPMDGFHLDNVQLDLADTRQRKGAPHTFDVGGLCSLVGRLANGEAPVYAPEFDRARDMSRNCAIKIEHGHDIVLIEGNYLLLNQSGWREISHRFDLSVCIDVPVEILRQRLIQRWLDHGLSNEAALNRVLENDLPNAKVVIEQSMAADLIYRPENH